MFDKLKSLFRSKPEINIESLEAIGVDMHSHLIPGIDDGVKTHDEAIEIISRFKELGYKKVITTPHTMSGGYDNTTEIITKGGEKLREAVKAAGIDIEIEAASEYYLDGHFEQLLKQKDLLTFGNNYILFELSYIYKPANLETMVFEMNLAGYRPILAHPERYPFLATKDLRKYKDLKEKGVFMQINLFSLVGKYGKVAQDVARNMIDEGLVDFVGSDIHNPTQLPFVDQCLKDEYVAKLLDMNLKNLSLL